LTCENKKFKCLHIKQGGLVSQLSFLKKVRYA